MTRNVELVPFDPDDDAGRRAAFLAGKAIGPVTETVWSVENGDVTREFVDEEHARKWWEQAGGLLDMTTVTSWVALDGWGEGA